MNHNHSLGQPATRAGRDLLTLIVKQGDDVDRAILTERILAIEDELIGVRTLAAALSAARWWEPGARVAADIAREMRRHIRGTNAT